MRQDPDAALLEPFVAHPERAAIITDFDGTLSAIVDDPKAARPVPGAVDVLHALAERYALVAVVSGRPVAFLSQHLGAAPHLALRGIYGMEVRRHGEAIEDSEAELFRDVVDAVAGRAERDAPAGVGVERKGLSVTIHYRKSPGHGPWADAWTAEQADATGLRRHPGRMSWELLPPVPIDKGTTVLDLAEGLDAVCFFGDDRGDVGAFSALDHLATHDGVATLKVVVDSPEVPAELLRAADLVVDGPEGAVELLRRLLP